MASSILQVLRRISTELGGDRNQRPNRSWLHEYASVSRAFLCSYRRNGTVPLMISNPSCRYIYSNKIDFDLSQIYESYKSLDKYLVHGFQDKLLGHIENNLNKSNCCIIFDQLLKIEKENVCLDFIESFIKINSSAALHSDSFLQIDLHSLIRLLNFDYLNVSEFEILEACARWVHAKLKKSNKMPIWQNVRKEFEEIRSLIKFTDLTVDELGKMSEMPKLRNVLSFSEMGSLFFYLRDKTTKPTIECRTNRLTVQPFVTEDLGVYHDSTCRESFTTRELYSNRRILISSIFTFIDTAFEANLSITNVQTKEEIKLEAERESHESKWVFHLRPHLEVCPTQRYSIKFAIKSVDSIGHMIIGSKKEFYYKRDGTDYQCRINVSSPNDCYYDYNYHFIRKIAFYDCSWAVYLFRDFHNFVTKVFWLPGIYSIYSTDRKTIVGLKFC